MTKIAAQTKNFQKSFIGTFLLTLTFSVSSTILRKGFGLNLPLACIISSAITFCLCYRVIPEPKPSFVKFFIIYQALVTAAIGVFWYAPQFLRNVMPEFWAYALPIFLMCVASYFLTMFFDKRANLLWWLLGSLLIAAFYGWLISNTPENR